MDIHTDHSACGLIHPDQRDLMGVLDRRGMNQGTRVPIHSDGLTGGNEASSGIRQYTYSYPRTLEIVN